MDKPMIPLSLLKDLRCRHCQKFVSCGPVYVVPDQSILCGRCKNLAKEMYRNPSYEALASIFRYPCQNWENHCSTTLLWNESLQHEEECTYHGCCTIFWNHPKAFIKGKREIPAGEIRQTAVPEHLLDQIKCVQCECYLSCDPVYIQSDGGNVCHRCVLSNGVSPHHLRNIAYERLSTIIVFPCIYRNRGCPTRLRFGRVLWQHETECSYGQTYQKIQAKNPSQKEKGVIKTHSGHYYGTITPNVVLFAPPKQQSEFEVNRDLLKSLKKQQERRFVRADEIGSQMEKMNSEDGSVGTDDSERRNLYENSSDRSSPVRPDYDLRSKQNTYQPLPAESGYYSNNKGIPPLSPGIPPPPPSLPPLSPSLESYRNSLNIPPVHQDDPSPRISRQNSYNKRNNYYHNQPKVSEEPQTPLNLRESFTKRQPLGNLDNNVLAGHYPMFMYPRSPGTATPSSNSGLMTPGYSVGTPQTQTPSYTGGLQHHFSFSSNHSGDTNKLSRNESIGSSKELIDELKIKLLLNKATKAQNSPDSPYKQCNNLEDILQTHDNITQ